MEYLQAVFTYQWSIQTYRNRVVHEGTDPNPMDVILTAQALSCRYKEAFNDKSLYKRNSRRPKPVQQPVAGPWQIILKITGARCNRSKRCSFAYTAVNMQGVHVFFGVASSAAGSKGGAMFEAMVDAAIRAKHHGFQYILFLGDDRRVVQAFRKKRSTNWLDNTR